jgi:hypothetical protein
VLDRVERHPTFDPRRDYVLRVSASELTDTERAAMPASPQPPPAASVDDIDLDLQL